MFPVSRKFLLLCAVILVIAVGTLGYQWIEGWDFGTALYMTIITLTTTGFAEVEPLSETGRYFTIFILLIGVGTVAYSISFFMNEIFTSSYQINRRKRMAKKIGNLQGHSIVAGYGRMGRVISRELLKKGSDFVVIDNNHEHIREMAGLGILHVEGDATHDEILQEAGIHEAKVVASMLRNDADNLYVSLAAKDLNPDVFIIARSNEDEAKRKLIRAGADRVVSPLIVSAQRVANTILNPMVEGFIDIGGVNLEADKRIQMADLCVDDHPKLLGKTLKNVGFKREGMIVLGIKKASSEFVFGPKSDYEFQQGDILITLSTPENYREIVEDI